MIAKNIDSFVLGEDPYPDWFQKIDPELIEYNIVEDELIGLTIQVHQRPIYVNKGDVIMKRGNNIFSVPRAAAIRYM